MAVFNTFSKRNNPKVTDVYEYDNIPQKFKVQLIRIVEKILHSHRLLNWMTCIETINEELGKEFYGDDAIDELKEFIKSSKNTSELLDIIDIFTQNIYSEIEQRKSSEDSYSINRIKEIEQEIDNLNTRFLESNLGYQVQNGQLIKINSQHIHREIIQPALQLIYDENFNGSDEEFRKAFKHFRGGDYKEAINEASKALESVLKTICERMNWQSKEGDTANKLIEIVKNKRLFPNELESYYNSLTQILSSGTPTIRNKNSGHGQGSHSKEVPQHLASFAINQAASSIIFLIQSYKNINNPTS